MLANKDDIGRILVRGKPLLEDVRDNVTSASVDMSTTMVTELTFTLEDPGFRILDRGWFDVETPVTYRGLKLIVAVVDTGAGGGLGGLTVKCRPNAVSKLKNLRGERVVKDITPAEFVKSECASVGVQCVVQPSPSKQRIARDVPQKGQNYDEASKPSAWTTFQRLANELGYLMYEVGGTVYFGKPTWLIERNPKVAVNWYSSDGNEPLVVPQFRRSIDNSDIELNLDLPLDRTTDVFPGYGITVSGFPRFSGTYFINSVNYPLAGTGVLTVGASTAKNPEPQKGGDEDRTEPTKRKPARESAT